MDFEFCPVIISKSIIWKNFKLGRLLLRNCSCATSWFDPGLTSILDPVTSNVEMDLGILFVQDLCNLKLPIW